MMKSCARYVVLLCATLCILPHGARARVGETELENQKRYGQPVKSGSDTSSPILAGATNRTYEYQGWRLRAAFLEGKAVRIAYAKKIGPGVSPTMKDDEIQAILDGESRGGKWKAQSMTSLNPIQNFANSVVRPKTWVHTSGNIAYLNPGSTVLTVESPQAEAFVQSQKAAKEQKRKAGIPSF